MIRQKDEDFGHKFELCFDDQPVSWLWVIDYSLTYEGAVLKMGGIGGVGTEANYRNKGYARQVLSHAISYMQNEGYHCSFLFGIPDFYWRFGYTTVLAEASTIVRIRAAEVAQGSRFQVRKAVEADFPDIRAMYNKNVALRCGGLIRSENWVKFPRGSDWKQKPACIVVMSPAGRLVGYAVFDQDNNEVIISEVETVDPYAQEAILTYAVNLGIQKRERDICFVGPVDHPFAVYCRRFGCEQTQRIPYMEGGMARICNIDPFFRAIAPALSKRVALAYDTIGENGAINHQRNVPTNHSDGSVCLQFATDIGSCCIRLSKSGVSFMDDTEGIKVDYTIQCKQYHLAKLVFGATDGYAFLAETNAEIDDRLVDVLHLLFPQRLTTIVPTDWF